MCVCGMESINFRLSGQRPQAALTSSLLLPFPLPHLTPCNQMQSNDEPRPFLLHMLRNKVNTLSLGGNAYLNIYEI